nr:immunoglobulin heavy chain junction region [Mus musculus]NSM09762.1 immunoglobulin heavy chain junction region [Mus musculus]
CVDYYGSRGYYFDYW